MHLRAARNSPEFPALLAQIRDSGAVSMVELAQLAGVSRSYLYELLGDEERKR